MPDFYQDLYTFLASFSGITDLVEDRIHPVKLPQKATLPAITTFSLTDVPRYTQSGESDATDPVYQISCWDDNLGDATALAVAVKTAISGYRGGFGTRSVGGILIIGMRQNPEPETGIYAKSLDARFLVR